MESIVLDLVRVPVRPTDELVRFERAVLSERDGPARSGASARRGLGERRSLFPDPVADILIALTTVDGSRMRTLSPSRMRLRGNERDGCGAGFALDVDAFGPAGGADGPASGAAAMSQSECGLRVRDAVSGPRGKKSGSRAVH